MTKYRDVANVIKIEVARLGFSGGKKQVCAFIIFPCDLVVFTRLKGKMSQCLQRNIHKDKETSQVFLKMEHMHTVSTQINKPYRQHPKSTSHASIQLLPP